MAHSSATPTPLARTSPADTHASATKDTPAVAKNVPVSSNPSHTPSLQARLSAIFPCRYDVFPCSQQVG